MICKSCEQPIVAAAQLPNGCAYRHELTGFRSCWPWQFSSPWAEPAEQKTEEEELI